MFALEAAERLNQYSDIKTILDVGSGRGEQAIFFEQTGKKVQTISLIPPADFIGSFENFSFAEQFDAIWMSHVLEHTLNPDLFLKKAFEALKYGGILAITVPPLKHNIVGGHINLFNAGILIYRLILAGFDCKNARVGTYGYNISILVKKEPIQENLNLIMDCGDIEKIAKYFPCPMAQNFDGRLPNINW
jgi:SAM-dependent methyltransferase